MGCLCAKSADRDNDTVTGLLNNGEPSINNYDTANVTYPIAGKCVDICGLKNTKFIIQSGTHYIKVDSLKDEVSVSYMKPLREVCKNGDHYMARYDVQVRGRGGRSAELNLFTQEIYFIIKGKSCVEVKSLDISCNDLGLGGEWIFDLHRECQGGSYYFANKAGFYIIYSEDNTYLQVRNMSVHGCQPDTTSRHKLHKSFTNGLYYFATDNFFYVLKEHTEFGLVYHRTKDLRSNVDEDVCAVSPSIASLMRRSTLGRQTNQGIQIIHIKEEGWEMLTAGA